jgi:hypothetical protein
VVTMGICSRECRLLMQQCYHYYRAASPSPLK